jgi:putative ABC transport system permease protein
MLALQAWRSWRNARAVAILAASALTVGIGAATAIYTVVNAVMLRPLPYRDGGRFVAIFGGSSTDPTHISSLSAADARAYAAALQAFDAFGWFREAGKNLMYAGEPHHVQGVAVTTPLVPQLGVDPILGQWFTDDSGVVISRALWQRLGGDPAIVGKGLTLDGRGYTVTGVMPETFRLPVVSVGGTDVRTDVWTALDPNENAGAAYFVYARLKPGVTVEAADADADRIAAVIAKADPIGHPAYTAILLDLRAITIKEIRPTLLLLFAASGLLFLITCANAAGLLLARSVERVRDTATRVSLGAGRRHLATMYFLENLPVALAGTIGGLIASITLTPAIVSLAADYIPRSEEVVVDWTVLLFALAAGFLATALSGLVPLWQALRAAPADVLGDGARTTAGVRSRRVSHWLVVGEIALAFALLAVSAVLTLHLRQLARTAPGFDSNNLLTFMLSLPGPVAAEQGRRNQLQQRLVQALQALPGVERVAFSSDVPLDGCCFTTRVFPDGRPIGSASDPRTSFVIAGPGYFETMRMPLLRGRLLTDADRHEQPLSIVINDAAARLYWPDRDPVGARGKFLGTEGDPFVVVGIVGNVKNDGLGRPTVPEVYLSSLVVRLETMKVVMRTSGSPRTLLPAIRHAIATIDPEQPIHDVAMFSDIVRRSMTLERVASFLTVFFAATAMLMAMLGIYGVLTYFVRQRTVEIGTRLAIGATSRDILSLIVGGGLKTALYGVLAGVVVAAGSAVAIGRVFDIGVIGPTPFLYSALIVGTVAFAASVLPAWRASLLSPMVAIRNEPTSMWRMARDRAAERLRVLTDDDYASATIGPLITEVAASLRRARSFPEATQVALSTLQEHAGAQSVTLLESSGDVYRCEQLSIPAHGFLLNRLLHYPHPLAFTERDFDVWLRWAREFRPQHVAEIERLSRGGVRMAVPLRTKTEVVGVLLLGAPNKRERYTSSEKQLLRGSADVFALMIENGRLSDRAVEQEKLRKDVALAAEVQRRLLPSDAPHSPVASFAAFTLAARIVGGDYYDFLDLGAGRIGLTVADVSGKGVAAALLMSVVQASLRVISSERDLPLPQLAARMNAFLHQSTGANKYATFFYAQLDERNQRLTYVNAGHNPPFVVRRAETGAEVVELAAGGTVIGLFPEMDYEAASIDLQRGDLMVAFTDGVTEALNTDGEEFGEERLKDLLRGARGATAPEIASLLTETMKTWIGSAEQHDDLTFVVLSMRSPSPPGL